MIKGNPEWNDSRIRRDLRPFRINLGMTQFGFAEYDLNKLPNIMIAGDEGCGKTTFLNCISYQCEKKGAEMVRLCGGEGIALALLQDVKDEAVRRLEMFRELSLETGENITFQIFNETHEIKLRRIIVTFDEWSWGEEAMGAISELSMMLKERVGIHIIYTTKTGEEIPDWLKATSLRICGRVENSEVSERVLRKNPIAATIPGGMKGRFFVYLKIDELREFHGFVFGDVPKTTDCQEDDFRICIGESEDGPVTVDLNESPHIMIGGVTGCGKSVELRNIVWQCVKKGAKVYAIDFRGGIEFGPMWENYMEVVTDYKEIIALLVTLNEEVHARQDLLKQHQCHDIDEYNKTQETKLAHIVLVCDELMEIYRDDSKEAHLLKEIAKWILHIAQSSRNVGIHLVFATQKPERISDGIRTNITTNICGKVGRTEESEIMLGGNPIAATISHADKGRFYTDALNGVITEIHGNPFNDYKDIIDGDYEKGITILQFTIDQSFC